MGYPKVIVAEVRGFALGGGFEMALMADISSWRATPGWECPRRASSGRRSARCTCSSYRLGRRCARRSCSPGDTLAAEQARAPRIFTEVTDDERVEARASWWARKAARMPADGIVIAKEAFRLVEQLQGYQGEEVASYLFHAFGTNLQFGDGEFNFVKSRAEHGRKRVRPVQDALRSPGAVTLHVGAGATSWPARRDRARAGCALAGSGTTVACTVNDLSTDCGAVAPGRS
jgi:hypothetical protein